jgi:hypothetical protein
LGSAAIVDTVEPIASVVKRQTLLSPAGGWPGWFDVRLCLCLPQFRNSFRILTYHGGFRHHGTQVRANAVSVASKMRSRLLMALAQCPALVLLAGCGGGGSGVNVPPSPAVSVAVSPPNATVRAASEFAFHAVVSGSVDTAVTWQVNGVAGGSPASGTIDNSGLYIAPSVPPAPPTVTVTAVAKADTSKFAVAHVTVTISITVVPAVDSILLSSAQCPVTQQFTAIVSGTNNSAVDWSLTGLPAGSPTTSFGSISADGFYTSPSVIPTPPNFSVTATSQADPQQAASASVTVSAGGPSVNQNNQSGPILLGTSGGNAIDKSNNFCCSGTLGALVTRNGEDFILSNNHVLARNDRATPGEAISQPGLIDNRCRAAAAVATYTQAAPLQNASKPALADAALAQVLPGQVDASGAILQLGTVACGGLAQPAPPASSTLVASVGMPVAKSGRTTGLTCGTISAVAADGVKVQYPTSCGSSSTFTVTFNNQVLIQGTGFSDAGDSGSLIVSADTAEPTALLFAGDASSGVTVANPIQDVLTALADPSNQALPAIVGGNPHPVAACTGSNTTTGMAQSPVQALPRLSETGMARARAAKSAHLAALLSDQAVLGVGIGSEDGSDKAAIVVLVQRGKQYRPIPESLDGVSTRVQEIGSLRAFNGSSCATKKQNSLSPTTLR